MANVLPNPVNADQNAIGSAGDGDAQKRRPPPDWPPWLGASPPRSRPRTPQLPIAAGTACSSQRDCWQPGGEAGLSNDMLLRLDDQILTNPHQLRTLIGTKKDGDTVRLTYLRKGQEASVQARIGMRADDDSVQEVQNLRKTALSRLKGSLVGDGKGSYYLWDSSGVTLNKEAVNAQLRLSSATRSWRCERIVESAREILARRPWTSKSSSKRRKRWPIRRRPPKGGERCRCGQTTPSSASCKRPPRKSSGPWKTWHAEQGTAPKPKPAWPAKSRSAWAIPG